MHRIVNSIKHPVRVAFIAVLTFTIVILGVTACTSSGGSAASKDAAIRNTGVTKLQAEDPAHTMSVSQTRKTINAWIDRWGKDANKLSYNYFENDAGKITSFVIFKGLPVSYCTALTPTQTVHNSENGNVVLNAPSVDGVYYSGGECNTYYGFTADGAYVEYTVGLGINVLTYDQPLPANMNVGTNLAPNK
jgi:hypothetical protein